MVGVGTHLPYWNLRRVKIGRLRVANWYLHAFVMIDSQATDGTVQDNVKYWQLEEIFLHWFHCTLFYFLFSVSHLTFKFFYETK